MNHSPCVVLGVDPAWTRTNPSGVALVAFRDGCWRTLRVAPSYAAFVGRPEVGAITLETVLSHAEHLSGAKIDVAALDIPLSSEPITARRACDTLVSKRYGARKCAVHSPTAARPGALSAEMRDALARAGVPLVTEAIMRPAALEVYPHVSLLSLLGAKERVPYKVGRARQYWPEASIEERRRRLLAQWGRILDALEPVLGRPLTLPAAPAPSAMKGLEDQIDALLCAWTGIAYLAGELEPLGDRTAAIWCPREGAS